MDFIHNLLLQCFFLQHNQSFLESQGTFHILIEISNLWVTFSHSSLDVGHALVIPLCGDDLIPQYRHEDDVLQQKI
jgi:hypothetical protein